jgi:CRISPR system Cascade subunit CasB
MEQKEIKTSKTYYPALYKKDQRDWINEWWRWLHSEQSRGERAKLRRCQSPQDVLTQQGFLRLGKRLPDWQKYHLFGLATIAGVLSHVKTEMPLSFPKQLGEAKEGSDKPVFSELRFQKLLASSDIEEFYKSLHRAVKQAGEKANPVLLADGILHWYLEQNSPEKFQGQKSWKYRWANDYYNSKVFN